MASLQHHMLNEVHVGCPKAPNSTPPCMFCRRTSHQPSSSQPKLEGHIPCSTSLMSHAQSHLTPPQKACSATTQPSKHRASPRKGGIPQQRPTLNEVHAARPKAPGSTPPCMFHHRTSSHPQSSHQRFPVRRQHRNIPCSTRLMSHAQRHPIPTSRTCSGTTRLQNIGLAQGWPSITTTSHTQRGSSRTPEGTQFHPTLHVSSSYQPSTILKPAQVRRQHRNIPFSTRLMSHAQRRTQHCLTVQVSPPHGRRQPPSSADHHPHAPSICPCVAHSAWGMGVAEDIGVPPCPAHAD